MEDLKTLFDFVLDLLKMPITIYGFTISFWSIIVWTLIATVCLFVIGKIFNSGGGE